MPAESLITVTDATFAEVVLASRTPVLVDFWAEWCPPCRPMARVLAELADEFRDQVLITTLDVDANPETTRRYRVISMPTLLVFTGGVVTTSLVGARPKSVLRGTLTAATTPYANI
ncbi:thioredoxin [Actinoplanes sp. GCM10030250]|uniref:thioredoxin n=1 Tax=Actinoplanes sp. GCM10030250 TaxID=3273376 RepID=UPI003607CC48